MTYEVLKTLNLNTVKDRHIKVRDYAIKKLIVIYEVHKTLNLDIVKDRHTKIHDYVIKKLLGLDFQL